MKFTVTSGEPVVTVTLPAKTATDRRILMLDNGEVMISMLRNAGYSIAHHGHLRHADGVKCPHEGCGATRNTLDNTPSLRYVTPGGDTSYPSNPRYLSCTVCVGPAIRNSGLFRALYPKNQAKHLDEYSITKLHLRDYIAVRCDGKTAVGEHSFQQVARLVTTNQPSLDADFSALLIRACAADVAKQALAFETFPFEAFVNVPVTFDLWPKARWHNETMTATDTAGIRDHAKRVLRQAAQDAELEVQALRDEIAQRPRA
jgi:hypothetical protein